ncbi:unnamed protein product [Arctogadus glacialis]
MSDEPREADIDETYHTGMIRHLVTGLHQGVQLPTSQKVTATHHCEMAFVQFLGDALAYLKRASPFKGLYIKPGPRRQPAALCKVLLPVGRRSRRSTETLQDAAGLEKT